MLDDQQASAPSVYATTAVAPSLSVVVAETADSIRTSPSFRQHITRLIRYSATSGIALGISELTLVLLYSGRVMSATIAALIANLVGTIPSYLLSRYWIWSESDRKRVGRQVVLYWVTSVLSMIVTSFSTGAITSIAPSSHKAHVIVAGVGFLAVSVVLWGAKYVVYQRVIFRERATAVA